MSGLRWLTEDAEVVCQHANGRVRLETSQSLVTIGRRVVLLEPDPVGRTISGCPNIGATIKPCQHTLRVDAGYSEFVRVNGKRVVLESLSGLTDGTPPGIVKYEMRRPGQDVVRASA
jgi:hypothetical protein